MQCPLRRELLRGMRWALSSQLLQIAVILEGSEQRGLRMQNQFVHGRPSSL
jgi:hypothetical protein